MHARQLVLWSGILFAWELIGIDIENVSGDIASFAKSVKSPQAIPWVFLVLVGILLQVNHRVASV